MTSKQFGKLSDGREVTLFTLHNKKNTTVALSTLGAALVSINVPDKNGVLGDVLLGHENAQGYVDDNSYLGFIVGRYGNRIAKGKFSLGGKAYQLGYQRRRKPSAWRKGWLSQEIMGCGNKYEISL